MNRLLASRSDDPCYRLLVDAITDYAVYMLDPDGRVSSWNPGAERFKGYAADEIIGEDFSRFYTEEDRAIGAPAAALRAAREAGRFEAEGWRLRKDGGRFWAHVVIDAIRDDAGRLLGFAKVTRDITERREAQQALETAREALLQSQKMEAVGQLTGGVAHDFNNLLMAVLGSLELLRKRLPDDPRALALLDNAVQGAERGATLTQRMLAFARKQRLRLESIDLAALVAGMAELLARSLGPALRLKLDIPANLPPVLIDPHQLETALLNLALNGRDAMPDGGDLTIAASAERIGVDGRWGLAPGDYVRLSVIDTGVGMDAEALARAVEPFYTTKDVGRGTGLGLSMVHGLAEQAGGRLVLASRPGEGVRADLWLRQGPTAAVSAAAAEVRPAGDAPARPATTRPLTVLAVDDDALVLANIAGMLEDLGHRVISAASGEAALTVLEATPVDLVITDHAMPRMTGLELALQVRALRPDLPIILASGYAQPLADADDDLVRLAKPFNQAALARLIGQLAADPAEA
ncbi:MAG: PAS domain S-box protein [Caulobacter sp.]|nr:PAS domain S-box protein [Caulobacter sp.]